MNYALYAMLVLMVALTAVDVAPTATAIQCDTEDGIRCNAGSMVIICQKGGRLGVLDDCPPPR